MPNRHPRTRSARGLLKCLGLLFVAIVLACEQSPTSPLGAGTNPLAPPGQSARWMTPGGEDNSPQGGAGPVLGNTSPHDGTQDAAELPGFFKYRTIVQVNVTGTIKRTTNIGPFNFPDYGVTGTGAAPGDGAVWIRQTTSTDPATAVPGESFIAYFQNRVQYGRNGSAARPSNTNPSCGNLYIPGDPDCLVFSSGSGTQLSYSATDVQLTSTVDANRVPSHGIARFDIAPAQSQIQGRRSQSTPRSGCGLPTMRPMGRRRRSGARGSATVNFLSMRRVQ